MCENSFGEAAFKSLKTTLKLRNSKTNKLPIQTQKKTKQTNKKKTAN